MLLLLHAIAVLISHSDVVNAFHVSSSSGVARRSVIRQQPRRHHNHRTLRLYDSTIGTENAIDDSTSSSMHDDNDNDDEDDYDYDNFDDDSIYDFVLDDIVDSNNNDNNKMMNNDDEEFLSPDTLDTTQVKDLLLDLLPRMKGKPAEYAAVESYVNTLEERYVPVQTLDFLNMAISGDWQLLFSTNLASGPKPNFRLTELIQTVEPNDRDGICKNQATWELAVDTIKANGDFDCGGTFTVYCNYEVTQGSRMSLELKDHVLELARGSRVPKDVPELVGLLNRAMPKELFDPNGHSMDTTYLDGDLRITRMTGSRFEGVRDIFIRRGSMEINPTASRKGSGGSDSGSGGGNEQ